MWHKTFKIVNNHGKPSSRSKEIGENQIVSCQPKSIWEKQQQTPWGADGGIRYPFKFGLGRIIAVFHRWNVHPKTSNVLESTFGKVSRACRLTLLTASHWELPLGIFDLVVPFILTIYWYKILVFAQDLSLKSRREQRMIKIMLIAEMWAGFRALRYSRSCGWY